MLENIIRDSALDLLAWLQVEEGTARVTCENSQNDPIQYYGVAISSSDASLLIGKHGDTLTAFQQLLRQMVTVKCKAEGEDCGRYQIRVDVDGYLDRKVEQAIDAALRQAEKVQSTGEVAKLLPLPGYLRRAVHLRIAEDYPELTTESIGQGREKVLTIKRK